MSLKNRQIIIVVLFSCLSVLTYMVGLKIDYGSISISSNTSNFEYSLDGTQQNCQKPSCTHSLRPGSYSLSARKEGFFDIQDQVKVIQGQGLDKQLTFVPRPVLQELSGALQPEFTIEGGSLISIQPETLTKHTVLSLDPSKKVISVDYKPSFSQVIVQYEDTSYFYDLATNKSYQLKFIDDIQPESIALFARDTALIRNKQMQVFTQILSPEVILLEQGSQFVSTDHYLEVDGGYLAVLPSSKQQAGSFSFQDLASQSAELIDSEGLIESFRNQVKSLFFFSEQTNNLYEITVLDTTDPGEVSLSKSIINSNSSPILQVRNTFYQIQL